jgi:peptide/nickel transport system permease protein
MLGYVIKRILSAIPTLFIVAVIVFVLIRLVPGNPAQLMLGDDATREEVLALEIRLGLREPMIVQFGKWMGSVFTGNFGDSLYYNQSVLSLIVGRIEPTFLLVTYAMLIGALIGIPLGITAARRRNGIVDRLCMMLSMLGISIPGFWLGLNLVILFSVTFRIFPSLGYSAVMEKGLLETLRYLTLPALALGLQRSASLARVTRSSMLDVLGNDYIRTAKAKGLAKPKIVWIHALKNAANPLLTQLGISVAHLLGGSVVMERLFSIPGIGRLAFDSIGRRDYPTIQGHILFVALVYVCINLIIDLLYRVFDPRVEFK